MDKHGPTPEPRRSKTETLSLRLDPKIKFILEFVARINGQSITTVVERAIKVASESVVINSKFGEHERKNWSDFWDTNEGVRTLRLLSEPAFPTNFYEDELRDFTVAHRTFFYLDQLMMEPNRAYVSILWPLLAKYLDIWRTHRSSNYWAAGEAMKKDLLVAKVSPPTWPPAPPQVNTLDDEIPF
jgi:hypothetical protein